MALSEGYAPSYPARQAGILLLNYESKSAPKGQPRYACAPRRLPATRKIWTNSRGSNPGLRLGKAARYRYDTTGLVPGRLSRTPRAKCASEARRLSTWSVRCESNTHESPCKGGAFPIGHSRIRGGVLLPYHSLALPSPDLDRWIERVWTEFCPRWEIWWKLRESNPDLHIAGVRSYR